MTQQDVVDAVTKLCDDKFGGDFHRGFNAYANAQGVLDSDSLWRVLKDAGIGYWLTRGLIVSRIVAALDTDKDGVVSWVEFMEVL